MLHPEDHGFIVATHYDRRAPIVYIFVFEDGTDSPYFYIGRSYNGTIELNSLLQGMRENEPRNQAEAIAISKEPKKYVKPALSKAWATNMKKELLEEFGSDEKCLNASSYGRPPAQAKPAGTTTAVPKPTPRPEAPLARLSRNYDVFPQRKSKKPVLVGKNWYNSVANAAANNCCSATTVINRINSDKFPDWQYAEPGKYYKR